MDNSNKTEPIIENDLDSATWLEEVTIGGFRVWHIIVFCLGAFLCILILICCCIKFRIPRTKQEIEADYQRKQIIKRFREKIYQVDNSDMDNLDLPKALALIQSEFLTDESSPENGNIKSKYKTKTKDKSGTHKSSSKYHHHDGKV